eukprot:7898249-Pyramimonas_sp.AAC.1
MPLSDQVTRTRRRTPAPSFTDPAATPKSTMRSSTSRRSTQGCDSGPARGHYCSGVLRFTVHSEFIIGRYASRLRFVRRL